MKRAAGRDVQQAGMHLLGDCPCTDAEECSDKAWRIIVAFADENALAADLGEYDR